MATTSSLISSYRACKVRSPQHEAHPPAGSEPGNLKVHLPRSPPRCRGFHSVFRDRSDRGQVPVRAANWFSLRRRAVLSPAVTSSWLPGIGARNR